MDDRFCVLEELPPEYASERDRVLAFVNATVPRAEVYEVGSTAIPGAIGKGDIDILVRVPQDEFARTRDALDRVFQRNPGQLSNEIYQGYLVSSPMDIAIQLTISGGPHDFFLEFLERLRQSPDLVAQYNALKRAWDGKPMSEYRAAKSDFIRIVLSGSSPER